MVLLSTWVDRKNQAGADAGSSARRGVDTDRSWRGCKNGSGYVVGRGREGERREPCLDDIGRIRKERNLSRLDLLPGQELHRGRGWRNLYASVAGTICSGRRADAAQLIEAIMQRGQVLLHTALQTAL